jgi:hypothetical protein
VSFKGEVGAEKACGSEPSALKRRGSTTAPMLSDRFLTFFAASGMVIGLVVGPAGISCDGSLCCGGFRGCSPDCLIIMFRKGETGASEEADSGEDDGDESAMTGESKVEFVFVGEDSVEAEAIEVTLSRW